MNKRIRELAEQAEAYSYNEYAKKETGYTREHFFNEKFAELLLQAVYDEVKEELVHDELISIEPDTVNRAYLNGCNGGVSDALYIIKNFGKDVEL